MSFRRQVSDPTVELEHYLPRGVDLRPAAPHEVLGMYDELWLVTRPTLDHVA